MYNQGQASVSPVSTMNGHCSQGMSCGTQLPGQIDNVPLVEPETRKVRASSLLPALNLYQ